MVYFKNKTIFPLQIHSISAPHGLAHLEEEEVVDPMPSL
jgi:hypothetical protein